jgi:hypothetical protein
MQPCHIGRTRDDLLLTIIAGLDEGLHLARPRHGGSEQKGRIPRDRGLMPKRLTLLHSRICPAPNRTPSLVNTISIVSSYITRYIYFAYMQTRAVHAVVALRDSDRDNEQNIPNCLTLFISMSMSISIFTLHRIALPVSRCLLRTSRIAPHMFSFLQPRCICVVPNAHRPAPRIRPIT